MLKSKKLEVCAEELNSDGGSLSSYSFTAYEFENGVVLVPGETTNDWFFDCRDAIEANGTAVVKEVVEVDLEYWSKATLQGAIEGSAREFGEDEAIAKARLLIKD